LGAYYNGNPRVNLVSEGTVEARQGEFEQAVRDEEREIREDNKYEWLPVAKLGVSFRF